MCDYIFHCHSAQLHWSHQLFQGDGAALKKNWRVRQVGIPRFLNLQLSYLNDGLSFPSHRFTFHITSQRSFTRLFHPPIYLLYSHTFHDRWFPLTDRYITYRYTTYPGPLSYTSPSLYSQVGLGYHYLLLLTATRSTPRSRCGALFQLTPSAVWQYMERRFIARVCGCSSDASYRWLCDVTS